MEIRIKKSNNRVEKIKLFAWWGMNETKNFEVGIIRSTSMELARGILKKNKSQGVYSIKEITGEDEFKRLGVYSKVSE